VSAQQRSAAGAEALGALLGHSFRDPALLQTALTHPSRAYEEGGGRGNERLEFLGDAVLGLVVAELLFEARPQWTEGDLTRARAAVVNSRTLAERAHALGIARFARLGRTEERGGGVRKERVLANLFEALDDGYDRRVHEAESKIRVLRDKLACAAVVGQLESHHCDRSVDHTS